MIPIYLAGQVDWLTTQALYHGLPLLQQEGVVLCWPDTSYVCLGCHEPADVYNSESGFPVVRRKVGGTLVFLDQRQVFYQVILSSGRLKSGTRARDWYRLALTPVVRALERMGLQAEIREPADILVGGKKLSGNAGGQIEDSMVVVGNLLLDFSPEQMAQARSAPQPVYREAFVQSMNRHLITLTQLLSCPVSTETVAAALADSYLLEWGGELRRVPWEDWREVLETVKNDLRDPEWIHAVTVRPGSYQIKVREGIYLRSPKEGPYQDWVFEVNGESGLVLRAFGPDGSFPLESIRWDADGLSTVIHHSSLSH